ncbi:MAG: VapC toxin family PIN domain ribonuclease [Candidatus Gerdarchaeota archaeon]|nr:MAG: VapC toxin family PIN domain ribonuclease [Anaerolinea sp. 4484_236]RLI67746.1 MAG: VapC toxin family PIN domain ribonuclease [Candidatus Gerdarchaeota archaeon]
MAFFVLDTSVTMAWCFEDESNPYADLVLESLAENTALAPEIWLLEVSNVIVTAERRKRMTKADSVRFQELLKELSIQIESSTQQRIFGENLDLAREQHLSSYDASYLDLAMRAGCPVATLDNALKEAAKRCGVPIYLE